MNRSSLTIFVVTVFTFLGCYFSKIPLIIDLIATFALWRIYFIIIKKTDALITAKRLVILTVSMIFTGILLGIVSYNEFFFEIVTFHL